MATEMYSLAKIFNNRFFRIPDYQRGYAWGERQLADFWSDLERVKGERTHYCGQLTLEKVDSKDWRSWADDRWLVEEAEFEPHFVVDGQQRLTTAVILIQSLLEKLAQDQVLAGETVGTLRERFLAKSNGLVKSCLFGYARDNPSHEYFSTQVLAIPSNEYNGTRTVYTANLGYALSFFRERLAGTPDIAQRERIFKAIAHRFRFNLHELSSEIDVFVAFETMNNRGKALSRLELLKNRLIYLSTLADGTNVERTKVRSNINAVWRTIYQELGRHPTESLDDDEFLRAHWIVFFGYDKSEADPLTQFLLNQHFTTERLDAGALTLADIQKYVDSLQDCARIWQQINFPEDHKAALGEDLALGLTRVKRLEFGVLGPLLLAALEQAKSPADVTHLVRAAERFLLLVRSFAGVRSNTAEAESYRLAHELHAGTRAIGEAVSALDDRVGKHFSPAAFQIEIDEAFAASDGTGFYRMAGLPFLLFEYEEHLRRAAKSGTSKIRWDDFDGSGNSIEHIYPQLPEDHAWPLFADFDDKQQQLLTHSLGNLVAVSVAKNASLSRKSFADKKKGTDRIPGFSQGSFSELRIAQNEDWTPQDIVDRGVELLNFLETQWDVSLGSEEEKLRLLKLEWVRVSTE